MTRLDFSKSSTSRPPLNLHGDTAESRSERTVFVYSQRCIRRIPSLKSRPLDAIVVRAFQRTAAVRVPLYLHDNGLMSRYCRTRRTLFVPDPIRGLDEGGGGSRRRYVCPSWGTDVPPLHPIGNRPARPHLARTRASRSRRSVGIFASDMRRHPDPLGSTRAGFLGRRDSRFSTLSIADVTRTRRRARYCVSRNFLRKMRSAGEVSLLPI